MNSSELLQLRLSGCNSQSIGYVSTSPCNAIITPKCIPNPSCLVKGPSGATGPQGLQGFTGQTGATGSVSGLRRTNITFLTADYGCPGYASPVTYVNSVTYNRYAVLYPISVTTSSLRGCSTDVYTP